MPNELAGEALPAPNAPLAPQAAPAEAPAFQLPSPFADVVAGTIPGVTVPPIVQGKTDQLQEFVVSNLDEIMASGLDMHETDDAMTVFFNPSKVTPEQIDKAAKAGKLLELFPAAAQAAQAAAAPAEAPVEAAPAAGPLAGATVAPPAAAGAPNQRLMGAQATALKSLTPSPIRPNPVPDQLAKRPV